MQAPFTVHRSPLEIPSRPDELLRKIRLIHGGYLDGVPPLGRVDEPSAPRVNPYVVDLVGGGAEKNQVAVHQVVLTDIFAGPELLPGGPGDIDPAQVIDGPR